MEFDDYQKFTEITAIYPNERGVEYTALGLNGEAGEVAEEIKRQIRDDEELEVEEEIGDVLWYLARLCEELDISLDKVAEQNVKKLMDRERRDVISGDGDNR